MTWKGTDHIHCCTQIINLQEEKRKKGKQLSHRLGSHARTRVQRNRRAHGARKTRRPPPPRKKGPKQTGAEEGGCWHCRLGCRCLAWRGWGRCTAPRPQAVNTSGGHACAHPLVRSVRQAEADHVLQRAGRDPAPDKHQLVSPTGASLSSLSSGWRCFY